MSKVFGYSNKSNNSRGWFESDVYWDKEIDAIKDPEGGTVTLLPTSIPSPFARIDLVKTAFRNIVAAPNLSSRTVGGRQWVSRHDDMLVSHALDLAEMMFNSADIPEIRENLAIVVWDRQVELDKLKRGSEKHRRFAETLELYLDQDSKAYNFDLLKRLYLIKFKHEIIGCTSPSTLFFTTANDLRVAQMKLTGNDILFDDNYMPLHERDVEFQVYLHHLFASSALLRERMKEVYEYLDKSKMLVRDTNPSLFNRLNTLDPAELDRYPEFDTGTAGDLVEVLGVSLRRRRGVKPDSDFEIVATKAISGDKPLVLQNKFSKENLIYVNDTWKSQYKVPYVDGEANLSMRRLPEVGIQHPYLTVSDFLEPYLIRLVYPIDGERFFDGNITGTTGSGGNSYLLPLKKRFFDYFSAEDLIKGGPSMPSIEIKRGPSGSAKVSLRIPIKKQGEFVTFSREYFESSSVELSVPSEAENQGVVVEHEMGLAIFPFIKIADAGIPQFYRVQMIDRDYGSNSPFKHNDYNLTFYSDAVGDPVPVKGGKPKVRRLKTTQTSDATSKYYALDSGFDYIQVDSGFARGMILPKWNQHHPGQQQFQFAVDFGTSNTHIEYKATKPAAAFDIANVDVQVGTLIDPKATLDRAVSISELVRKEFIPRLIGKTSDASNIFRFPQRTALSESKNLDLKLEVFSLADFNIAFTYEKESDEGCQLQTNLKWAKRDEGNEKRVRAFLEQVVMMMRNKVLLNGGRLDLTKLVWFYPSSMRRARLSALEGEWKMLSKKYFGTDSGVTSMAESLAPFFYFDGSGILTTGSFKPVVGIDIGGGTTDVVVFQNSRPQMLTSFRFAANSIFGEGYTDAGANSNGLARKYRKKVEDLLRANDMTPLLGVLNSIAETGKSEDLNAFFFSIENAPGVSDPDQFSFNSMLFRDDDVKIVFLYFYAAIIYHIAKLMKQQGIEKPKNLLFSGTGSKILTVISRDNKILGDFSKKIFEHVYGEPLAEGLAVHTEYAAPKEVTCKGGLLADPKQLEGVDLPALKATLRCAEAESVAMTYAELNESVKEGVVDFVRSFNDFFVALDGQFGFSDNFGISKQSISLFKGGLNDHLRDYLEQGISFAKKLDDTHDDSEEVGESLFFYPIIGTISALLKTVADKEAN